MSSQSHPEAQDRRRTMLRTAMGQDIAAALADPAVIEVMVNPDGGLRLDRLFVGQSRIGHAWEARSSGETPKTYFSVKLDDPALTEPITAALFPAEDGNTAQLVWKRIRTARADDRSTNSF